MSFRARLAAAGLGPEWKVTMTGNRATMVSFRGQAVRVHRAYVDAPDHVVEAIVRFVHRLREAHHTLNAQLFAGALGDITVRVSRRMRRKLGHYSPATHGFPAEIAIGRRHIRDDTWDDVLHTLLHEMVHQWQDEKGYPLAHDARFRNMARAVGADPFAVRRHASG